ncbi:MAG: IMP dehydrogenase [Candidatus Eremiobacteraeota bacterium]|nr:IMP dehydrogenase [Candidatus Eremiobacteraeota bacterium]
MARQILSEPSRTLMEYRLLPRYTSPDSVMEKVSLRTPLVRIPDSDTFLFLNVPVTVAAMQAVSSPRMGIEAAKCGAVAFLCCSQHLEGQADMVAQVKRHKAGFVVPRTVHPQMTIAELHGMRKETGFSTFPVVDEKHRLAGMIGTNDYDAKRQASLSVRERMIPLERLEYGVGISDLHKANNLLVESHQGALPIVDSDMTLRYLVFRKDIQDHLDNPLQVVDGDKRLLAGAAVNTHDYEKRVPALVEAGVDVLLIDSSDGHSCFQERALRWIHGSYPQLPVMGGNVVTGDGFEFLVHAGASAVKVGMGSGTICITQEQKGTGRGLASALIDVVKARDRYHEVTGIYIPVIADGGIINARDIVMALALGADSVMMGRYFARMDEAPSEKVTVNNRVMKPYWGEGSARARQWKEVRYHQFAFPEGVEGFVEYAGRLRDTLGETMSKVKAAMATCGVSTLAELHREALVEPVSAMAMREGNVHNITMLSAENTFTATT